MSMLEESTNEETFFDSSGENYILTTLSLTVGDVFPQISDPVSDQVKEVFQIVLFVSICGLLSLFGVGANVVNIIVFVRQGFKDSINISLLGLTVADLGCALTMFWMSVAFNPLLTSSDLNFNPVDVVYLTGGWPHACFNRITSYVTAFITLERCLCITMPLKVKDIINPLRTKVIIISIFLVMVILFTPFYFVNKLEWIYNPTLNKTVLELEFTDNRVIVETITFPIHSFFLPALSLILVTFSTVVLITELNRKQKWRQTSMAQSSKNPEQLYIRDKKVVRMVLLMSVIFITCYTPATINFFMMAYNPDFSFTGRYANVFFVVWSFTVLVQTFSFSVNILVYFFMSSKFKSTLLQIMRKSL